MDTRRTAHVLMIVATVLMLYGCRGEEKTTAPEAKKDMSPKEAQAVAKDAYVYGFPMVVGYKALYNYVIDEKSPDYKGRFNQMACDARLFTPKDKAVVTPNSDTPYCMVWMDLRS